MKGFLGYSLSVLIVCGAGFKAHAYDTSCIVNSFSGDVDIPENVTITAASASGITMTGPVHLYNRGVIDGMIDAQGNNLFIYNSGTISGGINAVGANVVQNMRSDSEITNIAITGGNVSVEVDHCQNATFDKLKNINASSFNITESSIVINDFSDWQGWHQGEDIVSLNGNVSLIINNASSVQSGEVIEHTRSGDSIFVQITDLDRMYKPELVVANGGIVLNIVRETDYEVIFGTDTLEVIRAKHPNDKLVRALDAANNMVEFNRIKSLSYRYSHDILLRPIKMINKFSLMDGMRQENDSGVGIIPHYILSDKMNSFGGRLYVGYQNSNLYFNAGFSLNNFNYKDNLNDFSGMTYGLDIVAKQTFNKFWLGENLGFALTGFKADYVSSDDKLKSNPWSFSGYGDVVAGYDFEIVKDLYVSPNVGLSYQYYNVADVSDTELYVHGGTDIKYSFVVDGIKYEYALNGSVGTNGELFANIKLGFLSVTDGAGLSLNTSVLKDDFDYHYKFYLNAKVLF